MSLKTKCAKIFRETLTLISPELNASVTYFFKFKKHLHWKNPVTFKEKLLKIKTVNYNHNELVKRCADKYLVRDYVAEKGFKEILNPLYAVYDSIADVDWSSLPDQFALKLNCGSGCNFFCLDKSSLDQTQIKKMVSDWMKKKPWLGYAEMQYKGVKKKILFEKYLSNADKTGPSDYKFYCFNGKPIAVLYMEGRFSETIRASFFDLEWNILGINKKNYSVFDELSMPARPQSLDTMIDAASVLSEGFPFVRIDFYEVNGKAVFGEMTFTPSGSFDMAETVVHGKKMGEFLEEF